MARTKTIITHHPEVRRSCRAVATAIATTAPPTTTPPSTPVFSPSPSTTLRLLLPPVPLVFGTTPSSSVPQSTATASEGPFTTAIPTRVTGQGEYDEDMGSNHGTGSQSSSELEDSSGESQQTEHLEEE
ncbi:hypothetical protein Fot_29148 [Forsythia ovata]|uniref:Uncharacterized protein n=1 Tax=Forsythia ovata TaxID=205694 RepID=A0ABD1TR45_9LAMI